MNSLKKEIWKQHISDVIVFVGVLIGLAILFGMTLNAKADPIVVGSTYTGEDDKDWLYKDTLSDGAVKERNVRKPSPPRYIIDSTLIGTNEHPVSWELLYRVKLNDDSIRTNSTFMTKTQRERAEIKLPPMPEIERKAPGKLDTFGHVVKRAKENQVITEHRTMKKRDPVVYREIKDGIVVNYTKSGQIIEQAVKRAYSAKLESVGPFAPPTQKDVDRGEVHVHPGGYYKK